MANREYRYSSKELRVMTQDGKRTLTGYAAVFNSPSQDLGGWTEVIAPGAFTRSIKSNADVKALSEHDEKKGLLGRTKSGTLTLTQDDVGLRFACELPNTTLANDVAESIERRDIDGCSFGFIAKEQDWNKTDGNIVRTLKDVDLVDVSVTSNPAYLGTSVALRSFLFPDGDTEIPAELRDLSDITDNPVTEPETPTCNCQCPECLNGDCANCSDDNCLDENCRCMDMRSNKALAAIIERRLRNV